MFALYTVIFLTSLFYLLYYYCTRTFNYWKVRKVPGPTPVPFFGNIKDAVLRKSNTTTIYKELYDEYPNDKVIGIYRMTTPNLLIRDLDIVKQIFVKDFDHFVERGVEFSEANLGANLFHAREQVWRPLRNRFTPLFTTAKLKNMIYLIVNKGDTFINYVDSLVAENTEQNVYPFVQKFTMASISACAFGLDIDIENDKNMETLNNIDRLIFTKTYVQEFDMMFPSVLRSLNFSIFPTEAVKFFEGLVKNVVQMRNNTPSNRKDFMDLILELRQQTNISGPKNKENASDDYLEITDEIIAGQAFVFYVAGYETSATTMIFTLYELAKNPDIQEKVIAELDEALLKCNGQITYETISQLPYMEKVFDETLRKYPIGELLQRMAKTDYKVPGTNVTVEKGQIVLISALGIHRDEKYYPDPDKFDPERFSPENVATRHPCAYIPFGFGPRNCIGMRFAKVQSRICLAKLFSKYRFAPSEKTPKNIESFDPYRLALCPQGGMYLNMIHRQDAKY